MKVRSLSFDIFQKYGTSTPNPMLELLAKLGTKKPDLLSTVGSGEKVLENKILENHKFSKPHYYSKQFFLRYHVQFFLLDFSHGGHLSFFLKCAIRNHSLLNKVLSELIETLLANILGLFFGCALKSSLSKNNFASEPIIFFFFSSIKFV